MEIQLSQIVVTQSDSGVLEFNLLGSENGPVSAYDLLARVAEEEDKEYAEKLLYLLDVYEANRIIKDKTYWVLRDCVRIRMTWSALRRERINENKTPKTYLMLDKNTGFTKIGRSIHPKKREVTLQSQKPTIILLKVCDDNVESELHKKYAKKRQRGEWFKLSQEEIKTIIDTYNFHDYE